MKGPAAGVNIGRPLGDQSTSSVSTLSPTVKQRQRENLLNNLMDASEWLEDQIDGGDECRGRDSTISGHIRAIESAIGELK